MNHQTYSDQTYLDPPPLIMSNSFMDDDDDGRTSCTLMDFLHLSSPDALLEAAFTLSFMRHSWFDIAVESDCSNELRNSNGLGDVENGLVWEGVNDVPSLMLVDESSDEASLGCDEEECRDDRNESGQDWSLLV
jgi:hypothetical protein